MLLQVFQRRISHRSPDWTITELFHVWPRSSMFQKTISRNSSSGATIPARSLLITPILTSKVFVHSVKLKSKAKLTIGTEMGWSRKRRSEAHKSLKSVDSQLGFPQPKPSKIIWKICTSEIQSLTCQSALSFLVTFMNKFQTMKICAFLSLLCA